MLFFNKYALAIITLLLVGGLVFLFRKKTPEPKNRIDRRHYRTLQKDTAYSSPNTQGIYRLLAHRDSLLALTKNTGILIDTNLEQESKILDQKPQGRFSYYSAHPHDTAYFDAKAGIMRVSYFGLRKEHKTHPSTRNVLYIAPHFYFDYFSTDEKGYHTAEIRVWNSMSGHVASVVLLDYLFQSYVDPSQACMASQFEGNFFAIDEEKWGYAFHRGSYLLIGSVGGAEARKSIFDKGFVTYRSRSVDKGDGAIGLVCQPENENRYYYDGGFHDGKIYALSDVTDKPGHADIDVYDAGTFKYLYTLTTRLKAQNSYAHIMEFVGNSLYLYSSDGEIIKFSKSL